MSDKNNSTSNKGNRTEPNNLETKEGKLIVISDFLGCQRKNMKKQDLTMIQCKSSFFKVIRKFLRNNKNNHVCFMGEFFDRGPYVMDVIININKIKKIYGNQVSIVLGYADIQKLRFKYELDRDLLAQNIKNFPGIERLNIKTRFRDKKIFGRTSFLKQKIISKITRREEKGYILIIYERIIDLLTKTHGGKMEYCILINKNLADLYYHAKEDQNIELQILCNQIGAFLLVFPFVPKESNMGYLTIVEVKYIIEFLLNSVEKLLEKEKETRDDIYIRYMTDTFTKLKKLNLKEKYIYGESPSLSYWKKSCNEFYENAELISVNKKFKSIFCHNFSLLNFFETFRQFINFARSNKRFKKDDNDPDKSTNKDYYNKFVDIYNYYSNLKSVYEIKELDKKIVNENNKFLDYSIEKDFSNNTNSLEEYPEDDNIYTFSGGGDENISISNNSNINLEKEKKEEKRGKNKSIEEKVEEYNKLEDDFADDSVGMAKDTPYINIRPVEKYIYEINRVYEYLLRYSAEVKIEEDLNVFLAVQSFFLYIHNNNNEVNMLDRRKMITLRDIRKVLYFYEIKSVYIGGYMTGLRFPYVVENQEATNIIFTNISLVKKKTMPSYKKSKYLHSDSEDFKTQVPLRIKNYPIASANLDGEIEITSLNNYGDLTNNKTFLGDHYSHTFVDFFTTHPEKKKIDIDLYGDFQLNFELRRSNVNANMLPVFSPNKDLSNEERVFMSSNMLYFIMLENIKPNKRKFVFLILDLEKRKEAGKTENERFGSYFGYISDWFGFFWNEKRLYQKLLPLADKKDFKEFIKPITADEPLNLIYDKTYDERYIKIKSEIPDILYNFRKRIKKDIFDDKFINEGLGKDDFIRKKSKEDPDKINDNKFLNDVKINFDNLFSVLNIELDYTLQDKDYDLDDLIILKKRHNTKKKISQIIIPTIFKNVELGNEISKAGKIGNIFLIDSKTKNKTNNFRFVYKKMKEDINQENYEKYYNYYISEIIKIIYLSVDSKSNINYKEYISYYKGISFRNEPLFYFENMNFDLVDFIKENNKYSSCLKNTFNPEKNKNEFLNYLGKEILIKIIESVYKGLLFLHSKKMVHLNLKCKNVLVKILDDTSKNNENNNTDISTDNLKIKITDFDNSQLDYKNIKLNNQNNENNQNKENKISKDTYFKDLIFKPDDLTNNEYRHENDVWLLGLFLLELVLLMKNINIYNNEIKDNIDEIIKQLENNENDNNVLIKMLGEDIILNNDFVNLLIECFSNQTNIKNIKMKLKKFKKEFLKPNFKFFIKYTNKKNSNSEV